MPPQCELDDVRLFAIFGRLGRIEVIAAPK